MLVRLSAIAEQCPVEGGFISLIETARTLEVSRRTLRRDLLLLEDLGYVFEYDPLSTLYWGKAPDKRIL